MPIDVGEAVSLTSITSITWFQRDIVYVCMLVREVVAVAVLLWLYWL